MKHGSSEIDRALRTAADSAVEVNNSLPCPCPIQAVPERLTFAKRGVCGRIFELWEWVLAEDVG